MRHRLLSVALMTGAGMVWVLGMSPARAEDPVAPGRPWELIFDGLFGAPEKPTEV